ETHLCPGSCATQPQSIQLVARLAAPMTRTDYRAVRLSIWVRPDSLESSVRGRREPLARTLRTESAGAAHPALEEGCLPIQLPRFSARPSAPPAHREDA